MILIEPHDQLGGRVRAWPVAHGADHVTMSRGFHAFFRQYYNLRALLRRADPDLRSLVPVADYPLISADGHTDSFASIPRTPPLNLAAFVIQSPSFRLRDLAAVNVPAALELLDVDFPGTFSQYDGESAAAFLDRLHFPARARHLALEVFARSFFAHPDDFSAGELVAMFHSYFLGSSEGLLFDVPRDDYDSCLWSPLRRYLERLGVEVRTGEAVAWVDASQDMPRIGLASGTEINAALVLATDPATTRRLAMDCAMPDVQWLDRVAALRNAPPFAVWRLWLDRLVSHLIGRLSSARAALARWTMSRSWNASRRARGVGRLRAAARWSSCTRTRSSSRQPSNQLKDQLLAELHRVYPELEPAGIVAEEFLINERLPAAWHRSVAPAAHRGDAAPADRAGRRRHSVRLSGRTDGACCYDRLPRCQPAPRAAGVAGHDLWTVPMRSRHRLAVPCMRCRSLTVAILGIAVAVLRCVAPKPPII